MAQKYVRGNGVQSLNRRISVFGLVLKTLFLALIIGSHVIIQSQIKSVSRDTVRLMTKQSILEEELERLISFNEKIFTFSDIVNYAENDLKMRYLSSDVKSFTIVDKKELFESGHNSNMPELFDTNINLTMITDKNIYPER